MKKSKRILAATLLAGLLVLTACNSESAPNGENGAETTPESSETATEAVTEPMTINQDIPSDQEILSKGPHGEEAVSAKTLELTVEDIEKIREGNYKAALVMHYAGNDWSNAQINGLQAAFEKMGIEVISVTDAQFSAEKQVSDLESVLARNPDIIVSIPTDPVSTASAYKRAAEQGVKLVFMDNVPSNLEHGTDYVSVVSADNYGNGVAAADIMAEQLGGEGKVGVVYHDADFFVTKQRTEAFEATMAEKYPNIEIVARGGIMGPDDGLQVASAMLTTNPDLDGIFGVWDVPTEGILAAARTAGRDDLVITTIDLGTNVGLDIARGGPIKGLGAQLPYDQGTAEAILAGYALLGKEAPSYVAVPALTVTQDNILDAWEMVYQTSAPQEIQDVANQQ
ncbi:substrate-binding domain-containing protein [Halalkalibacter nanhaiisediminis]|uniref:Ribose transport system substrate-binding protein n=1 Tax=Halalkalibacter nanhaiisediminis TaxID=688079 RepID=A0A562Q977_9BACI|nr:substrate-binding domain-containing protein [Halalkalibacter nanhaiisediminis]TWI53269.1 ribose transport system substrate-binding protein [Halalkalibacter nanhaiisediminis]